ncbi:MAG: ubiquitin carboxyl-terminal hydrolase [Oscillospiraceae bacterium]|jgi:ubiquitin C-terminal hydrolase|nr:ubiquitin carboxyl-terminal hydrolase [Oscillospiraceae bacterium]
MKKINLIVVALAFWGIFSAIYFGYQKLDVCALKYDEVANPPDEKNCVIIGNFWGFPVPLYEERDDGSVRLLKGELMMSYHSLKSIPSDHEIYGRIYYLRDNFTGRYSKYAGRKIIVPGRFAGRFSGDNIIRGSIKEGASVYQLDNSTGDNFVTKNTKMTVDYVSRGQNEKVLIRGFTGDFYVISSKNRNDICYFVNKEDMILENDIPPNLVNTKHDENLQNSSPDCFLNGWKFGSPKYKADVNGNLKFFDSLKPGDSVEGSFIYVPSKGFLLVESDGKTVVPGKFITASKNGTIPIVQIKKDAKFYQTIEAHNNFLDANTPKKEVERLFAPDVRLFLKGISKDVFLVSPESDDYDVLILEQKDVLNAQSLRELFCVENLLEKKSEILGLSNPGYLCYLNCIIMTLFYNEEFKNNVLAIPVDLFRTPLLYDLQRIFLLLSSRTSGGREKISAERTANILGLSKQEDAVAIFIMYLTRLKEEVLNSNTVSTGFTKVLNSFFGRLRVNYVSMELSKEMKIDEDFSVISLHFENNGSRESFERCLGKFLFDGKKHEIDFSEGREQSGIIEAIMTREFIQSGDVLIFSFNRFKLENFMPIKLQNIVDIPQEITINGNLYRISSSIVHVGIGTEFGHYVLDILIKNKWLRFNDDCVFEISNVIQLWENVDLGTPYLLMYTKVN